MNNDGTDPMTIEELEMAKDPRQYIVAIKTYRNRVFCSLRAAKDAVDAVRYGATNPSAAGRITGRACRHCGGTGIEKV